MKVSNKVLMCKSFYWICDRSNNDALTYFNPKKLHKTDWERAFDLVYVPYLTKLRYLQEIYSFDAVYQDHSISGLRVFKTEKEAKEAMDLLKKYYEENDLPIGNWVIGEVKKIGWWKYFVISPEMVWAYR